MARSGPPATSLKVLALTTLAGFFTGLFAVFLVGL
jgi:hypothetical protein